ncbi:MAG: PQQ-dependent sugar dehydrogenase [Moritella sp.]|nr:PQQ-dependent sugar dehydrogenase [Moritella sp.]
MLMLTLKKPLLLIILCCVPWLCSRLAFAETLLTGQSEGMQFRVEKVAQGLGVPWGMAFLNSSQIIFTERSGKIKILTLAPLFTSQATASIIELQGVPIVNATGQGGMLDVAVPNDFKPGDWIYFTYTKSHQTSTVTTQTRTVTILARAKRNGQRLLQWTELLVTRSASDTSRHFGSRITFDDNGHLFFTVGDRGVRRNGQDLSTHAGSVLRLNRDGSVPADNPFVGIKATLPEIWSYGHRNPQGIFYDNDNNRLWMIEHGPRGGDEINLIVAGANYGWPVISYGKEYWGPFHVGQGTHKAGMEQPVKYYVPSIAPGSLLRYSGNAFPKWQGNLLAGALKLTHINRISLDSQGHAVGEERLLQDLNERVRALAESPEGWLYFSTDSGLILRLRPLQN